MKGLICFIAIICLIACDGGSSKGSRREQLQQLGLLGQHELRRIEQTNGMSGHMDGSFFLGIGSMSESLSLERRLQFYWGRTADEFFSTTLPYSLFRFVIDESKTVPTIEFTFDEFWLNSWRYTYTESEKSNLNLWLGDEMVRNHFLRVAVIKISRAGLEKEIYLPRQ